MDIPPQLFPEVDLSSLDFLQKELIIKDEDYEENQNICTNEDTKEDSITTEPQRAVPSLLATCDGGSTDKQLLSELKRKLENYLNKKRYQVDDSSQIPKISEVHSLFQIENLDKSPNIEVDPYKNGVECECSIKLENEPRLIVKIEKLNIANRIHKKAFENLPKVAIPIERLNTKIIEVDGMFETPTSLKKPLSSQKVRKKWSKEDLPRLANIIRKGEKFNKKSFRDAIRRRADVDEKGRALKYRCPTCSYKAWSFKGLAQHHSLLHRFKMNYIFSCTDCDYTTKLESALTRHLQNHKIGADLFCPDCPYKTRFDCDLRKHLRRWHLPDDKAKILSCPDCDFTSIFKPRLEIHMRAHLLGKQYLRHVPKDSKSDLNILKCNYCRFKTPDKNSLMGHLRQTHKIENAIEKFLYRCKICGFETKHSFSYRDHVLIHKKEEEVSVLECYDCGFKTKWKKYLTLHMRETHPRGGIQVKDKTTYKCFECAKEYHKKYILRGHIFRTHREVDLLMCPQCNFTTKSMPSLRGHVRALHINRKKKIYQCQRCSHATEDRSIHKDHFKTHKYICYLCQRRFTGKSALQYHVIGHMSKKKQEKVTKMYKCPCCEYKGRHKQRWQRHMMRFKHYAEKK